MEEKILEIIGQEDKRNPLTDEKISKLLSISREEVCSLRFKLGISDSRERRKNVLIKDIEAIRQKNPNISERKLTVKLNELGYQVSRYIVSSINKEIFIEDKRVKKQSKENADRKDHFSFDEIIGSYGSLKMQISQAKAAMLYPPHGLHTLIHGPSGVGKNQLVEAMYDYAISVGRLERDSPFIIFNCADYADNPQLLMSQLFGYKKGAFTGAYDDKEGIVEKANNGVLFLDEVHRLPSEGQEMLFYLIDKGSYRKLGETESSHEMNFMLIAATTEDLDSSLLITFRRRIPMVIDIPPLSQRPLSERLMIIQQFLKKEALRINRRIIVKKEALKYLLCYLCPGNIGQLRSDIQVACAHSFLKYIAEEKYELTIDVEDLPSYVKNIASNLNTKNMGISCYIENDLIISNIKTENKMDLELPLQDSNIYQVIENRYQELMESGYYKDEIYELIDGEMNKQLKHLFKKYEDKNVNQRNIDDIVGTQIIRTVRKSMILAKQSINNLSTSIYSPLCLHVSAAFERLKNNKLIFNPQLEKIKNNYPLEFKTAQKMALQYESDLNIKFPDEEIAFIAMYLKTFSQKKEESESRIVVIVLTHGDVGIAMAEVANKLLNVNMAIAIKVALDESPKDALIKTQHVIEQLDEGRGCLILTDMGSLVTFGDTISKNTGIDVRTISRVDTVMVIDAIRRAIISETTLDDLEEALNAERMINFHRNIQSESPLKPVIITTCMTGHGSALIIKGRIEEIVKEENAKVEVIPIGAMSEEGIEKNLGKIKWKNNVIAIVGNINVEHSGIPFFPLKDIIYGNDQDLRTILQEFSKEKLTKSRLKELLFDELIFCEEEKVFKNNIIDLQVQALIKQGFVEEQYLLDVYKREAMEGTVLGYFAIPHGFPEHVTKPAVSIVRLKEPILWEKDFETRIIFMPALKEDSSTYTRDLFKVCTDKNVYQQLLEATKVEEIKEIILNIKKPSI
ncbi:sigma 54-interacting transcriptional regulator [Irregularibacter muris]|uniref:Sigma 54-interacting transcriptional regulator n=1 Tax=Irregularibacter muris TaxID=1796619 RepID=A0AAE3KZE6_9FIRM|nr:sigma 54-interacting transcriptional regulator [Irregularibacter muris]MCR1899115.1 sigma 54-interacting transcriptional regulator [Irregularibacter muris]